MILKIIIMMCLYACGFPLPEALLCSTGSQEKTRGTILWIQRIKVIGDKIIKMVLVFLNPFGIYYQGNFDLHWLLQSLFLVLLSSIWPQDIDKLFIRFCKNRSMFIYLASWISKKNPSICYLCAISAYDYTVSDEFQCLHLVLVRSIIFKLRDLPLTHLIQRSFFCTLSNLNEIGQKTYLPRDDQFMSAPISSTNVWWCHWWDCGKQRG